VPNYLNDGLKIKWVAYFALYNTRLYNNCHRRYYTDIIVYCV